MNKPDYYDQFYPRQRTGKECKQTNCDRYETYVKWTPGGSSNNSFCMECKHAYISQYKPKLK